MTSPSHSGRAVWSGSSELPVVSKSVQGHPALVEVVTFPTRNKSDFRVVGNPYLTGLWKVCPASVQ
jgi:hypothetical protein